MRVYLQNFRSYSGPRPYVVNFEEGNLTCFSGYSGSGKTTIFLAIKWCLFGGARGSHLKPIAGSTATILPSEDPEAISIIRKFSAGPTATAVVLKLQNGDEICRRAAASSSLEVESADQSSRLIGDAAEAWVIRRYGTVDSWSASSYLAQGGRNNLLGRSNAEKFELLYEITFGTPLSTAVDGTKMTTQDAISAATETETNPTPFLKALADAAAAAKKTHREAAARAAAISEVVEVVTEPCPPLPAKVISEIGEVSVFKLRELHEKYSSAIKARTSAKNSVEIAEAKCDALSQICKESTSQSDVDAAFTEFKDAELAAANAQILEMVELRRKTAEMLADSETAAAFYTATYNMGRVGVLEAKNALAAADAIGDARLVKLASSDVTTSIGKELRAITFAFWLTNSDLSHKHSSAIRKLRKLIPDAKGDSKSLDLLIAKLERSASVYRTSKVLDGVVVVCKCGNSVPVLAETLKIEGDSVGLFTDELAAARIALDISKKLELAESRAPKFDSESEETAAIELFEKDWPGDHLIEKYEAKAGKLGLDGASSWACLKRLREGPNAPILAISGAFETSKESAEVILRTEKIANVPPPAELKRKLNELDSAIPKILPEPKPFNLKESESKYKNALARRQGAEKTRAALDSARGELRLAKNKLDSCDQTITSEDRRQIEERIRWEANSGLSRAPAALENAINEERLAAETVVISEEAVKIAGNAVIDTMRRTIDRISADTNSVLAEVFPAETPMFVAFSVSKSRATNVVTPVSGYSISIEIHYKTAVYDGAGLLSGGEADRLSLALTIALARIRDSQFVLLDECMSSLDDATQDHCFAALRKTLPGRTVVNVSHSSVEGGYERVVKVKTK